MTLLEGLKTTFIAGTLGQGGAERQLYYILSALVQAGADARVLSLTQGEYWEEPIRALGVPVTWVGSSGSRFRRLVAIHRELRHNRPAILQSHHFYTNLYAVAAARLLGCREIGASRSDINQEVKANGALLGRLSLTTPKLLAINSRASIQIARNRGIPPNRLHFLPNVVDCHHYRPRPRDPGEAIQIMTAGSLVQAKRTDRFLRIIRRMLHHSPLPFNTVILGDGPLRPVLHKQAAALGLPPERLSFVGRVAEPLPHYQQAAIFVLTSDWEGTPNVILEAMACGLPVVATRVGGVGEIIRDGETGFLCRPDDEKGLARKIMFLGDHPEVRARIGRQARKYITERHSLTRLSGYLVDLYRKTVS